MNFRGWISHVLIGVGISLCLLGCASKKNAKPAEPGDERLIQLNTAARAAFKQGVFSQAEIIYIQVLQRAYLRDDQPAIVDAKYNLGICYLRMRRYDKALSAVRGAKRDAIGMPNRFTAEILLLEGWILYRKGEEDNAWKITEHLITNGQNMSRERLAMMQALRGRIACNRGDIRMAEKQLEAMGPVGEVYLLAEKAGLAGCIASKGSDFQKAAQAFENEALYRRKASHYALMAEALGRAAGAHQQNGEAGKAANRFLRAGRSAQKLIKEALKWLNRAAENAGRAGDVATIEEANRRLLELRSPDARRLETKDR